METTQSAKRGRTLTDVVERAWRSPFSTKSDIARTAAGRVAQAACLGFITTMNLDQTFGSTWFVTGRGIRFLKEGTI